MKFALDRKTFRATTKKHSCALDIMGFKNIQIWGIKIIGLNKASPQRWNYNIYIALAEESTIDIICPYNGKVNISTVYRFWIKKNYGSFSHKLVKYVKPVWSLLTRGQLFEQNLCTIIRVCVCVLPETSNLKTLVFIAITKTKVIRHCVKLCIVKFGYPSQAPFNFPIKSQFSDPI